METTETTVTAVTEAPDTSTTTTTSVNKRKVHLNHTHGQKQKDINGLFLISSKKGDDAEHEERERDKKVPKRSCILYFHASKQPLNSCVYMLHRN